MPAVHINQEIGVIKLLYICLKKVWFLSSPGKYFGLFKGKNYGSKFTIYVPNAQTSSVWKREFLVYYSSFASVFILSTVLSSKSMLPSRRVILTINGLGLMLRP
ncbi:hypothetical protein FKM82_024376 [Ascaphus truei]